MLRGIEEGGGRASDEGSDADYARAAARFEALLQGRVLPLTILATAEDAATAAAADPVCVEALRPHAAFLVRIFAHYAAPSAPVRRAAAQASLSGCRRG
jgi:hypothetical protein